MLTVEQLDCVCVFCIMDAPLAPANLTRLLVVIVG